MDIQLTITNLSAFLLSLAFSFYPSLADWFDEKTKDQKQLIMIGLLFVATLLIYGASFLGIGHVFGLPDLQFNTENILQAIMAFVQAIVINAGTYKTTNYIAQRVGESRRGLG